MNLEIKIIKGNDVLALLEDNIFVAKWHQLADQNNKVTIHQEYSYVATWYRIYSNIFQPILILGYNKSEIVGLLPLASSIENHSIVHAGTIQAEYHGWLCKKEFDQEFPIQALISVKKYFKIKKWRWGWIPPRSNINWLFSDILKKENIFTSIQEEESPILDLRDDNKILKLKNATTRKKINRYKRRGDFYLERIKTKKDAEIIFDIIEKQFEFRHMAVHEYTEFADDPNKKIFQIEKLNFPEKNHFTVLWSNSQLIASNIGEIDSDTVHMGVFTHDPIEAKNSPGFLFIIKLAELLKEEGFKYLDLTPGGDLYKEEFSNMRQKLYRPTFYFNKKENFLFQFENLIKNIVKKLISPFFKPENILKIKIQPAKIIRNFAKSVYENETYMIYRLLTDKLHVEKFSDDNFNINKYSDLFLFNDKNTSIKKRDIISLALRRFTLDDTLYSITKHEKLLHYGWMSNKLKGQYLPEFTEEIEFPQNSKILYDFNSIGPDKQELFTMNLTKMLSECKKNGVKDVFFCSNSKKKEFEQIIKNFGFGFYCKLKKTKILGILNKKITFRKISEKHERFDKS